MKDLNGKKRILILGCGGAGKTVLALRLGKILGLPVHHLDRLWWLPGWVEKSREAFDSELAGLLKQSEWIIDGNYLRTLKERLKFADFVIVLNFSRRVCLTRIVRRHLEFRQRTRPDMSDGCRERLDPGFLRYVWNYRKRMFPRVLAALSGCGVPTQIFLTPQELDAWLRKEETENKTTSALP